MDRSMAAADLMTRRVVTIRASATVAQATQVLQEMDVRHLPVVDADRCLVGMLSDRDLRGQGGDQKVTTVMSSDVVTVGTTTELGELIDLMLDLKVGALPVVDPHDELVGIVSYMDVLRAVRRDLD